MEKEKKDTKRKHKERIKYYYHYRPETAIPFYHKNVIEKRKKNDVENNTERLSKKQQT